MMLVNGTQFTICVDEVRSIDIVPLDGRVLATIERGQDDYLMFVAEPGQQSRWLVPHQSSPQWQRPLMTTPTLAIEYLFNAYPDVVLLSRKSYDREVERRKQ